MKKLTRLVCILLILGMLVAIPAQAQSFVEPRGSAFFGSYGTDLYKTSSSSFQIWFDVVANVATMQELGVSEIVLYRSVDQENWRKIKTYKMENYPQMVARNTSAHIDYVTYNYASTGYYYTACITFYAKNSTGVGELDLYTEILRM